MAIKSQKEALATHLGWDIADMEGYRYHPKQGELVHIYGIGNGYYCAVKGTKKLPKE